MSEKLYKQYSVNPIDIVLEYCEPVEPLQKVLDDVGGWGIGQAQDFAEILNLKRESENTYNNTDLTLHLTNDIQWHILSNGDDSIYDENAFF